MNSFATSSFVCKHILKHFGDVMKHRSAGVRSSGRRHFYRRKKRTEEKNVLMTSIKVYKWVSICVPLWAGWGQLAAGCSAVCGPWQHAPARPPPLCPDRFMFLEPAPTHLMSDTLLTVRFSPVYITRMHSLID